MSIERAKEIRTKTGLLLFGYPGGFEFKEVINIISDQLKIKEDVEKVFLIEVLANLLDSNPFLYLQSDRVYAREVSFVQNR